MTTFFLRFPSRLRTRTTVSTTTQVNIPVEENEENTEPLFRRRFRPKEPRHGVPSTTTETPDQHTASENNEKVIISRPKPINRKSDLKPKVSIRPNLFSMKRRNSLTLRSKNKTSEDVTTTESVETTQIQTEVVSESNKLVTEPEANHETQKIDAPQQTSEEITTQSVSEDDYSKRVSDLTSSFHSKYDTPGFFKSVPSNSRRIPNHFTISTEDPILPIEAFFPNLKDKE